MSAYVEREEEMRILTDVEREEEMRILTLVASGLMH
jgi:hypothetical protein